MLLFLELLLVGKWSLTTKPNNSSIQNEVVSCPIAIFYWNRHVAYVILTWILDFFFFLKQRFISDEIDVNCSSVVSKPKICLISLWYCECTKNLWENISCFWWYNSWNLIEIWKCYSGLYTLWKKKSQTYVIYLILFCSRQIFYTQV